MPSIPLRRTLSAFALAGALAFVPVAQLVAQQAEGRGTTPRFSSSAGAYLAGRAARTAGDPVTSADFMARALRGDPNQMFLLVGTFRLSIEAGDVRMAMSLADRVYARDVADPVATLVLAVRDAETGEYGSLIDRAREWRQRDQRALVPVFLEAWAQAGLGDGEAAMAALATVEVQRATPWLGLEQGLIWDYLGEPDAAAESFEQAVAAGPDRRTVLAAARFFIEHAGVERALEVYDAYLAANPLDPIVRWERERVSEGEVPQRMVVSPAQGIGQVLIALASNVAREDGDGSLAAQIYARLGLHLDSRNEQGLLLLGGLLRSAARNAEADRLLGRIPEDSPVRWYSDLERAQALRAAERLSDALAVLGRLSEARPEAAEPHILRGNFLRIDDRMEEAAEAYDAAFAAEPDRVGQDWYLHFLRAIALTSLDRWPEAERDLEEAVRLNPDNALVLNYLGYMWVDQGINIPAAGDMIRRAVELEPRNGHIIDSLGWYYFRIGDFDRAVTYLERATEREPENAVINDHLGDAYWMVGRRTEAGYQWRRALRTVDDEAIAGLRESIEDKIENGLVDPLIVDLAGSPANATEQ